MTERLRGVVGGGRPDLPTAVPIDHRPLLAGQIYDATAAKLALTYQAIVRDLARLDPLVEVVTGIDASVTECSLCHDELVHHETCPWRRARELFPDSDNPVDVTGRVVGEATTESGRAQ